MIDKTLARMIDGTLQQWVKLSGIPRCNLLEIQTLLEIEVNQPHLVGLTRRVPPLQCQGICS
jgi:hypothetical protein